MLLGPDPLGSFIPIAVKSIHRKRMPVKEVRGGQTASFALKKVCSKNIFSSYGEPEIIFYVCLLSELLLVHKKKNKTNASRLSSNPGALCADQAFVHKERDGDGIAKAVPTGHLGVRGRDPGPAPPHYDIPPIPGHGWVALRRLQGKQPCSLQLWFASL